MEDPGVDRHQWESEWEALEPLVVDSPGEALPELDDLIGRMLAEEGYPLESEDAVDDEGIDPEILTAFRAAHEIRLQADQGQDVDPGDIGAAVGAYRELYEHLTARGIDES
jgi:hypothetical protein